MSEQENTSTTPETNEAPAETPKAPRRKKSTKARKADPARGKVTSQTKNLKVISY